MDKRRGDGRTDKRRGRLAGWMLLTMALLVVGSRGEEKPLGKVELLLLESQPPSIMTVGLHIELAPGWHLYWINPGDAGLAPEITWELPPGYEAGPLQYPIPEKIVSGEIVAYGFKNEVLIVCQIQPAGTQIPAKPPTIACRLSWMACQESCVTGRETVKLSPAAPTAADRKRSKAMLSRFGAKFPGRLEMAQVTAETARLIKSSNGWQVEFPLLGKEAGRVSDFFPYPIENFVIAHNRITVSGGNVIIPLEPSGPAAALARIDGLLILGDDAYEVSIPVKPIDHSS